MDGPEHKRDSPEYLELSEEWSGDSGESAEAEAPVEPEPTRRAARAAPPPDRPRKVRGIARGVNVRDDVSEQQHLTFRIDRYDDEGNRLAPVPVELRRYRGGIVTEGDEVEVSGRWAHGTLIATRVVNHSTSSEVRGWFPRSAKWIALVAVLLVLAIIAAAVLFWRDRSDEVAVATVPAVAGQPEAAAIAAVRDAGFVPERRAEHDDGVPAGSVIRTDPPPGFPAAPSSPVAVIVSQGPVPAPAPAPATARAPRSTASPRAPQATSTPTTQARTVAVPNVRFESELEARRQLNDAGLLAKTIREKHDAVPEGDVIRTDPEAGTEVAAGSTVTLYVSDGP